MPEAHAVLNALGVDAARAALRAACGAERWVARMLERRPFASDQELLSAAADEWQSSSVDDYLEAFSHHPQIGEDLAALELRFASTSSLSKREQSGVEAAPRATLLALSAANRAYRERFGFIFIICATGKTAGEMLAALEARSLNERGVEIALAAAEQAKITRLRLLGLERLAT